VNIIVLVLSIQTLASPFLDSTDSEEQLS